MLTYNPLRPERRYQRRHPASICFCLPYPFPSQSNAAPTVLLTPMQVATTHPYAEALTLARALRSSKRACFLRRMTLKRSKSESSFLLAICARFFAQLVFSHFLSISDFSHCFFSSAWRAPRFRFSTTRGDRRARERRRGCLLEARSGLLEGPSMSTCSDRVSLSSSTFPSSQIDLRACGR